VNMKACPEKQAFSVCAAASALLPGAMNRALASAVF